MVIARNRGIEINEISLAVENIIFIKIFITFIWCWSILSFLNYLHCSYFVAMASDLSDEQLRAIYAWIDAVPLSRPKKNITRDFADGILLAEVIAAYFPDLVELHNYPAANSVKQKVYNFETLNQRVLKRFGYNIPRPTIDDIVNCRPGAIEGVLNAIQFKMAKFREKRSAQKQLITGGGAAVGGAGSPGYEPGSPERHPPQNPSHARAFVSPKPSVIATVDQEILLDKERQIAALKEHNQILELKIGKLEQLVRLKDQKIQKFLSRDQP